MKFLPLIFAATALLYSAQPAQASNNNNNNPDDPTGKQLYIVSPSCNYYKCKVHWARGSKQKVTWWNAPKGDVKIQLVSEGSGKTYSINTRVSGTHSHSACHSSAPKGKTCGTYTWTVPDSVALGEYTVMMTSLSHKKTVGYTDTVVISKRSGSKRGEKTMVEEEDD